MKVFIVVAALVAFTAAMPAEEPNSEGSAKQKRGIFELAHAPALVPAAPVVAKSYATPIIHAGPVVTKVFDAPPVPFVRSYAGPLITGPLVTRGIGPHIYGAKTYVPAPVFKAAPVIAAPVIPAPVFSKPILAHAPIYSYAPKYAPIAYEHGW